MSEGAVEFNGASFAWGSRAWEGQPDVLPGETDPESSSTCSSKSQQEKLAGTMHPDVEPQVKAGMDSKSSHSRECRAPTTLHSLKFKFSPGEFVGVAGEVRL